MDNSPRSVAGFFEPAPLNRIDNVNVNSIFYNLRDTIDRLLWLGEFNDSYNQHRVTMAVDTLTRIRAGHLGLIDRLTGMYWTMPCLVGEFNDGRVAWESWWIRYGVRTHNNDRTPNEYIRLWASFREGGTLANAIDLTYSDDEGEMRDWIMDQEWGDDDDTTSVADSDTN